MGEFKNKHKSNTYYIGKTTDSQPDWNSLQIPILQQTDKNASESCLCMALAWLPRRDQCNEEAMEKSFCCLNTYAQIINYP